MSANGKGNRSGANAEEAIALQLASGKTLQEAATAAGISPRTISRRQDDAAFRQRVAELRTQMVGDAVGKLAALGGQAVETLTTLLTLSDSSAAVKLGAARTALEFMFRSVTEADALHGLREAGDASPMDTGDMMKLLAACLRQLDAAELPTAKKSRLTATLADALLRAIGVDALDKRLEALQAVLLARKDKDK